MSTGSLSRGLSGLGVALATHPHLLRLQQEQSYTSTLPLDLNRLL